MSETINLAGSDPFWYQHYLRVLARDYPGTAALVLQTAQREAREESAQRLAAMNASIAGRLDRFVADLRRQGFAVERDGNSITVDMPEPRADEDGGA